MFQFKWNPLSSISIVTTTGAWIKKRFDSTMRVGHGYYSSKSIKDDLATNMKVLNEKDVENKSYLEDNVSKKYDFYVGFFSMVYCTK